MALEQKQKEYNWYYTQAFARLGNENYSRHILFVTFAATPTEAKNLALDYVFANKAKFGLPLDIPLSLMKDDIHLYKKNYIRESRGLVSAGKYTGVKPESV